MFFYYIIVPVSRLFRFLFMFLFQTSFLDVHFMSWYWVSCWHVNAKYRHRKKSIAKTLFVKTNCCILITVHIPKLNVWWSMNWLWKWKSTVEKLWNAILIDDDVYTLSLLDLEFQQMYQLKKGFYKSYYTSYYTSQFLLFLK